MPAERVTSRNPWHVLLLIDDSGSMSGEGARAVNEAMLEMIEEMKVLSQGTKPYFKLSVVQFGSSSRIIAEAVSEQDLAVGSVTNFAGDSGGTSIASGLRDAHDILTRKGGSPDDFDPFIFLFSDGRPDDAGLARNVATEIKAMKIPAGVPRIITIGMGSVDEDFMIDIASKPEFFKKYSGIEGLKKLMPAIGTLAGGRGGAAGVEDAIMKL